MKKLITILSVILCLYTPEKAAVIGYDSDILLPCGAGLLVMSAWSLSEYQKNKTILLPILSFSFGACGLVCVYTFFYYK